MVIRRGGGATWTGTWPSRFSGCTWAVSPPNTRVGDSRCPSPAREGRAPCWCVRSLRRRRKIVIPWSFLGIEAGG
eukprot:6377360-Prymnesium_polylepis.2